MCCRMRSRPISTRRWIWAQRRCRRPLRRRHATRRFHKCDFSHRSAAAIASSVARCGELERLGRGSAREENNHEGCGQGRLPGRGRGAAVYACLCAREGAAGGFRLGRGGGGGGEDMMTQMAPMLEMMKAKMGKRRFAMLMQTMGPMMSQMMEGGGGFGGMGGGGYGGGFGGLGGGGGYGGIPGGYGGGDV